MHSSDPIQHRFHCVSSEGEEESFLSARKAVPERVERLSYFWVLKGAHAESSHLDNLLDEGTRENSLPVVEHTLGYEATEDLDLLSDTLTSVGSLEDFVRYRRKPAIESKLSESLEAAALIGPSESMILGRERPISLSLGL